MLTISYDGDDDNGGGADEDEDDDEIITTTFLYTHILVLIITKGLKDSYSHSIKDKGETLRNQVTWEGER